MLSLPDLGFVHDRFLSLSRIARERFQGNLARKLICRAHFDPEGVATVIAGTVAGAASLCIDDDAGRLREGLRTGLCDFVVGNLDEALRILKNELRRGLAVSVGLTAEMTPALAAIMERGVQPDLLALDEAEHPAEARTLVERGAISIPRQAEPESGADLLIWRVPSEPARLLPRIAEAAAQVLNEARADTAARRMWLARASRALGRSFGSRQCSRMTEPELEAFVAILQSDFPAAVVTRGHQPV